MPHSRGKGARHRCWRTHRRRGASPLGAGRSDAPMPRGGWRHHSHALPPAEKKEHRRQPPSADPHQLRPSDTHRISRCGRPPPPPPWEAGSARGRGGSADLNLRRVGAGDAEAIAAGVVGVVEQCQISSFYGFLGIDKRWMARECPYVKPSREGVASLFYAH